MKRKNDKIKGKVNSVIFWVCLIVLIFAVTMCIWQGYKKHQANLRYDELRQEVETPEEPVEDVPVEEKVDIPIDFATVQSQYPDAYAWIRIPDTQVDYPIMQSSEDVDEDYYLNHTIDGEENLPGAIYTQRTKNKKDMSDPVTVVYGHNMRNDSMFGILHEYRNEEFRQNHPEFYIYTPEHIYKYQIFAAVTYSSQLILGVYDCSDKDEYDAFLASLKEPDNAPSWVNQEVEVTTDDQIVVLSTCTSTDAQRYLICGVLVEVE